MITRERMEIIDRLATREVFGKTIERALAEADGVPKEVQEVAQAILKEQKREKQGKASEEE